MPEDTQPSQEEADIILYVMLTVLMVIVAGIVLDLFGLIPALLKNFVSNITILVTGIAAVLAIRFIYFKNVWQKARRVRVILASSLMASLVTLLIIANSIASYEQKENMLQATATAQTKATYVDQFNATMTTIAKEAHAPSYINCTGESNLCSSYQSYCDSYYIAVSI